jgi:glucose/arabinose dehydrogenase
MRTWLIILVVAARITWAAPVVVNEVVRERVASEKADFRVVKVIAELEHPWAMEFLPDGRMLVTERPGRLWVRAGETIREVRGLPEIRTGGQGGLLDVIAHPRFAENEFIYLSYAATYGDGFGTRIARAKLEGETLAEFTVLLEMSPPGSGGVHFGSRFAFDAQGYLYATFGERGDRDKAQQLDTLHGKIVRLFDDGRVPDDNPFTGRAGARPEIFSYGHRNPQGLVFDLVSGILWSHEHGPRGGDALHVVRPGRNYGWPLATYGREYFGPSIGDVPDRVEGVEQPVIHWTPSIAPCGLTVLHGGAFRGWQGNLFAGALAGQHLRRIELDGERVVHQEVLLQEAIGRIRDVVAAPDGTVWLAVDEGRGGVYRIEPLGD